MRSWYTIRCPDGYTLKEWAETETDAKQKCAARLDFQPEELDVISCEPFGTDIKKKIDYAAMARGAALGLAKLKGEQKP